MRVPEAAAVVWERLTDLDRHSATIPLTRVVPAGHHMRPDLGFVGETRLGPWRMADRMVVRRADPPTRAQPGRLVVEKFGPIAGVVEATVEQVATGTLVVWRQSLRPAWLPALFRPPGAIVAGILYKVGLRQLVS